MALPPPTMGPPSFIGQGGQTYVFDARSGQYVPEWQAKMMGIPYVGGAARALMGAETAGIAGAGMPPVFGPMGAGKGLAMGAGRLPKAIPSGAPATGIPQGAAARIAAMPKTPLAPLRGVEMARPSGAAIAGARGLDVPASVAGATRSTAAAGAPLTGSPFPIGGTLLGRTHPAIHQPQVMRGAGEALKPTARVTFDQSLRAARGAGYPIRSGVDTKAEAAKFMTPASPRVPGGSWGNLAMLKGIGSTDASSRRVAAAGTLGLLGGINYLGRSRHERDAARAQAEFDKSYAQSSGQSVEPTPPSLMSEDPYGSPLGRMSYRAGPPAQGEPIAPGGQDITPTPTPTAAALPQPAAAKGYEVQSGDWLGDIVVADFIAKGEHSPSLAQVQRRIEEVQKEIGLADPKKLQTFAQSQAPVASITKDLSPKGQWQKMFGRKTKQAAPPSAAPPLTHNWPAAEEERMRTTTPEPGWEKAARWGGDADTKVGFVSRKAPSREPIENMEAALEEINTARDTSGIPKAVLGNEPRLQPSGTRGYPDQTAPIPGPGVDPQSAAGRLGDKARYYDEPVGEMGVDYSRFSDPLTSPPRFAQNYAHGGGVSGGVPGKDSVNILAQQGEYVLPKPVVDAIQTGQPPPQGNAPFVDLFREWQPQTPEGERYKQELGAALATQSAPAGGVEMGGKAKGYQYGGLLGAVGGQAARAGASDEWWKAAPRRKPARQTYKQSDPTGGATFRKKGRPPRPTYKQSDPTGGAWIRKPGTYQKIFKPQTVNESVFQRPVVGQVPFPGAASTQQSRYAEEVRRLEAEERRRRQEEELRRAQQQSLLSQVGAWAGGALGARGDE